MQNSSTTAQTCAQGIDIGIDIDIVGLHAILRAISSILHPPSRALHPYILPPVSFHLPSSIFLPVPSIQSLIPNQDMKL